MDKDMKKFENYKEARKHYGHMVDIEMIDCCDLIFIAYDDNGNFKEQFKLEKL